MANLYEINKQLLECVDLETGEVVDYEKLKELNVERNEKIENIALWIKNLVSDAEAFEKEEKAFEIKKKIAKNKAMSLKRYLEDFLNGETFSTNKVKISYRKSKSVVVEDPLAIPERYLEFEPKVDKTRIKQDIEQGIEVAGAYIEEKQNIQIK